MELTIEQKDKIVSEIRTSVNFTELLKKVNIPVSTKNIKTIKDFLIEINETVPLNFGQGRRSVIYGVDWETLQNYFDTLPTISEILNKFGLQNAGGNANTLKTVCKNLKIDYTIFNNNKNIRRKIKTNNESLFNLPLLDVLKKQRKEIKKYIIYHNLIPYKCNECNNLGIHNNKTLALQLDHINGISNDNELSNLRFLCPNCHSQTHTFSGKNVKPKSKIIHYKKPIEITQCISYAETIKNKPRPRKFEVTKDELEKHIRDKSLTEIGKIYGVSDNAVRNRCKSFEIDVKQGKFAHK